MSSKIIFLTSLIAITSILAFSGLGQSSYALTDYTISDDATGGDCGTLGGTWDDGTNTCTFTNYIDLDGSLTVNKSITVVFQSGELFTEYGPSTITAPWSLSEEQVKKVEVSKTKTSSTITAPWSLSVEKVMTAEYSTTLTAPSTTLVVEPLLEQLQEIQ